MTNERKKILSLIASNKISIDEGEKLLKVISKNDISKSNIQLGTSFFIKIANKTKKETVFELKLPIEFIQKMNALLDTDLEFSILLNQTDLRLEKLPWTDILKTAVTAEKGDLYHRTMEEKGFIFELEVYVQ